MITPLSYLFLLVSLFHPSACDEILDINSGSPLSRLSYPVLSRSSRPSYSLHAYSGDESLPQQATHHYHDGLIEDVTEKLGTIIKLVENGFGKTVEKIDKLEQTLSKRLTHFEETVEQLNGKVQSMASDLSGVQYLADRLNKIYNIHTETYRICKDAALSKGAPPSSIFMTPGDRAKLAPSETSPYKPEDNVSIENGSSGGPEDDASSSHRKPVKLIPSQTKEQEEMIFVISTVANVTLERYLYLLETKLKEKLEEEYSIINFRVKELFRENCNSTSWSLRELREMTATIRDGTEQANAALLAIKDEFGEKLIDIEGLSERAVSKIDSLTRNEEESRGRSGISTTCQLNGNISQLIESPVRSLLDEYLTKIATLKSSSRERTGANGPGTTVGRSVASSSGEPSIASTFNQSPAKEPVEFITVDAVPFGSGNPSVFQPHPHPSENTIETSASKPASLKPDFQPIKKSFQRSCTTKTSLAYPSSCAELRQAGASCNSVYVTLLRGGLLKHLYCDMSHQDGGWTVFLRRGHFSTNKRISFDHTYASYRSGFGDSHLGEFFLGLDTIHQMTREGGPYVLHIDLEDVDGEYLSFEYDGFTLGGLADSFRFKVDGIRASYKVHQSETPHYHQIASSLLLHNGTQFLTSDKVRQLLDAKLMGAVGRLTFASKCASFYDSGWWYGHDLLPFALSDGDACATANGFQLMAPLESLPKKSSAQFTGVPHWSGGHYGHPVPLAQKAPPRVGPTKGIFWSKWNNAEGRPRQLKYVLMKIRPEKFTLKGQ